MGGLILDRERMHAAAASPLLLATDAADELAATGIPFREAHEIVSKQVAEESRYRVDENRGASPLDDSTTRRLENALNKKSAIGGTSPARVKEAAQAALESLR